MKIINDPLYGFIDIPDGLLLNIVKHPLMQRLTRINQLGMASVVYPGARHSRFLHSIGAFHLTGQAIMSLQQKGHFIFDSEAEAVEAAILMHDIGHGPFSHVLEHTIISGISHEDISLLMMEQINRDLNNQLGLAISIFKDNYPKRFLHQLISSQLDMDRLDYLRRDAFFTGVSEGNIGSARIIAMLDMLDDNLVVNYKGINPIENYLISRRTMYWQVYLHKTVVGYEKMLVSLLSRAKYLTAMGCDVFAPPALSYFLRNDVDAEWFATHDEAFMMYQMLDDNDIMSAIKVWATGEDKILSTLATNILTRRLFKVEVFDEPVSQEYVDVIARSISKKMGIPMEDTHYLVSVNAIQKDTYDISDNSITIVMKDGTTKDIAEASEILNVQTLAKKNRKYFLCYARS
ncbi:MAG: HD domain-containing protein [Prevotella sp.]|nr:HD domain-containing protein [Prevotella sp.]